MQDCFAPFSLKEGVGQVRGGGREGGEQCAQSVLGMRG